MIKLVRVDHRLLHGQVIFSWTKQLSANYIIVADDKVPNDPIPSTNRRTCTPLSAASCSAPKINFPLSSD